MIFGCPLGGSTTKEGSFLTPCCFAKLPLKSGVNPFGGRTDPPVGGVSGFQVSGRITTKNLVRILLPN